MLAMASESASGKRQAMSRTYRSGPERLLCPISRVSCCEEGLREGTAQHHARNQGNVPKPGQRSTTATGYSLEAHLPYINFPAPSMTFRKATSSRCLSSCEPSAAWSCVSLPSVDIWVDKTTFD